MLRATASSPFRLSLDSPLYGLAGFGLGLVLAWHYGWQARDLVWSLWLSSLVLGYATIVLGIVGSARQLAAGGSATAVAVAAGLGLFLLAFFTVHFGMFHVVHSVFLNFFFPLVQKRDGDPLPSPALYGRVLASYWPWLLAAAIAERTALRAAWQAEPKPGAKTPLAFSPDAAYRNVVRMHLLIFFFFFTSFLRIENRFIYAVVYVVYFFPPAALFGATLLKKGAPQAPS
ncbi:MAG: DUF6498-containing protein [Lentisphaeria bacterium]